MAPVGAISKAQKQQKDLKVSKYSLLRHPKKTQKLNRIGAPEGTLLDFSSILSKIVKKIGGALLVKKKLKESLNAQKTESQCQKKGYVGTLKTLYLNIRTLKTLYPNFEPW